MSKKLTRKGLALGTILAFAATGLTSVPGQAASEKLITIKPTAGQSYVGVIDTAFQLTITEDASATSQGDLTLKVENASEANIKFADGGTGAVDGFKILRNGELVSAAADASGYYNDAVLFAQLTPDTTSVLDLTTDEDAGFSIKLTAWNDRVVDGAVSASEVPSLSATETVKLVDPAAIKASATVLAVDPTNAFDAAADAVDTGSTALPISVSLGDVNANYVTKADWKVAAYKNSVKIAGMNLSADADLSEYAFGNSTLAAASSTSADNSFWYLYPNTEIDTTNVANFLTAGKYTARVIYNDASDSTDKSIYAGKISPVFDISAASDTSSALSALALTSNDDSNVLVSSGASVRVGKKQSAFTLTATNASSQVLRGQKIAVFIHALDHVSATDLAGTASITGARNSIPVSSYIVSSITGTTNADGEFSFTVDSSVAAVGDTFKLTYAAYGDNNNTIGTVTDVVVTYVAAAASSAGFTVASDIASGATPTLTFSLKDQFEQPISKDVDGASYKVQLEDNSDDTLLKKSATFASGSAKISFSNYLEKGGYAALTATLYTGASTAGAISGATLPIDLYNPEATGKISVVDDELEGTITYSDFVTGKPASDEDEDTEAPLPGDSELLEGSVEDTTGAALPGAVVVISGSGLQFEEVGTGEFFKDTITVVADENGSYSVNVWAHKVDEDGIAIRITSGGKSAKATFITDWNAVATADDLVVKWNPPLHPAIDRTYIVTALVTDKWGNPLKGAKLDYTAGGALTVNGDTDVSGKKTNASGKSTVYVRSVAKTSGYAELTVELVEATIGAVVLDNATGSDELGALDFDPLTTVEVLVGKSGSAAASKTKGLVKVTAYNATGKTVKAYVSGKLVATKKATKATYSFNVKAKAGSKTVKVVVDGSTFFNESVTVK